MFPDVFPYFTFDHDAVLNGLACSTNSAELAGIGMRRRRKTGSKGSAIAQVFALNAAMNLDQRAKPRRCTPECPSVLGAQFLHRPHIAAASMENRNEYPAPERRSETPSMRLRIPATLRLPLFCPSVLQADAMRVFTYRTTFVDPLLKRNASCTSLGD
jgi:hypothetical protein